MSLSFLDLCKCCFTKTSKSNSENEIVPNNANYSSNWAEISKSKKASLFLINNPSSKKHKIQHRNISLTQVSTLNETVIIAKAPPAQAMHKEDFANSEISNSNCGKSRKSRNAKTEIKRRGSAIFSIIPIETTSSKNNQLSYLINPTMLTETELEKAPKYTIKELGSASTPLLNSTELKGNVNGLINAGRDKKDGIVFFYNYTTMNVNANKIDVMLNNKGSCNQSPNKTHLFLIYYSSPSHTYKINFNTLPFIVDHTTTHQQIMSNNNVFIKLSRKYPWQLKHNEWLLINDTLLLISITNDSPHSLSVTNLTNKAPTKHYYQKGTRVAIGNKNCSYYLGDSHELSQIHIEITYVEECSAWLIQDGSPSNETQNEVWIITCNNEYTLHDDWIVKINERKWIFNCDMIKNDI